MYSYINLSNWELQNPCIESDFIQTAEELYSTAAKMVGRESEETSFWRIVNEEERLSTRD